MPGAADSERLLTDEGRYEVRRVISAAKLSGARASLVLSSPYKRALQTAGLAKDLLDCEAAVLSCNALVPDGSPQAVWEEIRVHHDEASLLLAGHEPLLSALTAYLLGCPDLEVNIPTAGLVRVDVDALASQPRGILLWMLTPALTQ